MGIKQRAEIISKNQNFLKKQIFIIDLKDLLMKNKWVICLKLC
jgi:hypothetical protein